MCVCHEGYQAVGGDGNICRGESMSLKTPGPHVTAISLRSLNCKFGIFPKYDDLVEHRHLSLINFGAHSSGLVYKFSVSSMLTSYFDFFLHFCQMWMNVLSDTTFVITVSV